MTKALRVAGAFLLLISAVASPARAQSKTITGEARWGGPFEARFGDSFTLTIDLLGKANDAQDGIYVSILNTRLPKDHQFVVLPELIGGSESNYVGVFVPSRPDPRQVLADLRATLDRFTNGRLKLTYFTQVFDVARLEAIENANLTLGHHGDPDATYAGAQNVIDAIAKKTAVFTLLDYTLSIDPAGKDVPHIASIRFSFEPDGQ